MSRENVELVREGFDAFQEGDLSRMLDLMAEDLVTYRADRMGWSRGIPGSSLRCAEAEWRR